MMNPMQQKKWTPAKIRKVLGPALIVLGMLYTYRSHSTGCPRATILAGWAIVPPIWLAIEYLLLFDRRNESLEDFQHFRHVQQLTRNIWIGMVILLGALYLGKWD